jgi:hypothetical protein
MISRPHLYEWCGFSLSGDLKTKEAELIFGRDERPACSITISVSESLLTQSARTVLEAE